MPWIMYVMQSQNPLLLPHHFGHDVIHERPPIALNYICPSSLKCHHFLIFRFSRYTLVFMDNEKKLISYEITLLHSEKGKNHVLLSKTFLLR